VCGVFGVWAPGEPVANLVFYGLYALQHRGQESAGMAVADGRSVLIYREMGLVSQVFDEATLATLQGHLAIGHTRYSTTGDRENAQPAFKTNAAGGGVASDLLTDEVAGYLGADSLGYLSLEALTETAAPAGTGPDRGLCTACFTGSYPIPIPDAAGPDLMPSAATQPSTLPLPNP
jgi:glutamine phosphoribosylpyrophosphate amidotransferase